MEPRSVLDCYRPREEWFSHDARSIHGLGHVARVLIWADIVARAQLDAGEEVDVEAVLWAAAVHDVGRHNDGWDPLHGERSSAWLRHNHGALPVLLRAERLSRVAYCCRWHVPPDSLVPKLSPELRCVKDADGLDRVRIHDLNPAYLRTSAARSLVEAAWDLYGATSVLNSDDPWTQVREAALVRGLWR